MLIDTEKEHGRPPLRKSECDFPVIGKSQFPLKATLSSISKGLVRCTEEVVGILLIIFSCSTALQDNERFSHQGVVSVDYFPQGFSDIVCLIVLFPVD